MFKVLKKIPDLESSSDQFHKFANESNKISNNRLLPSKVFEGHF